MELNATGDNLTDIVEVSVMSDVSVNYTFGGLLLTVSIVILATTHKIGPTKKASVLFFYQMTVCALLDGVVFTGRSLATSFQSRNYSGCKVLMCLHGISVGLYANHMLFVYIELYLSVRNMTPSQQSAIGTGVAVAMSVAVNVFWVVVVSLGFRYDNPDMVFATFGDCSFDVFSPGLLYGLYAVYSTLLLAMVAAHALVVVLIRRKKGAAQGPEAARLRHRRRVVRTMVITLVIYGVSWLCAVLLRVVILVCAPCRADPTTHGVINRLSQLFTVLPLLSNGAIFLVRNQKLRPYIHRVFIFCRPNAVGDLESTTAEVSRRNGTQDCVE